MFIRIKYILCKIDDQGRIYANVHGEDMTGAAIQAEYRTNQSGFGLYEWNKANPDWRQILGDSQFYARSTNAMRNKIQRMLEW